MKRKQYILFGDTKNYCIIDTVNKLHTEYYSSTAEVTLATINKNNYIYEEGRVSNILNSENRYQADKIILESDIPIIAENYPELLI